MNYRWDSWGHKDWDNLKRLSWALILQHIFDDLKDNTNISENQLKEFIKNLADNVNIADTQLSDFMKNITDNTKISESQFKDFSKVVSEHRTKKWSEVASFGWDKKKTWLGLFNALTDNEAVNIVEYIANLVNKIVPEQQIKNWSESNKYSWSVSKGKEWSWTDIFKTLVGSESVNIVEYFTAILTKYINANDNTNLFDIVTKNIGKNNLDATNINEVINFIVESLYVDTATAIELVKKDIHKCLPEHTDNLWGKYIKNIWNDLSSKTIQEVLKSIANTEYIGVFDFLISEINKNIGDNVNLSEIKFFDFAKLLQESANINEFIAKFIEKKLADSTKMFDEVKKDVRKNISDITDIEEETYHKLHHRPVRVEMDILDMNYNKVAILTNAWDVCIAEVVNGEYSLSFKMPINDPIAKLIDDKHYIQVKKQTFFFASATSERTQSNQRFINVEAQHIFFELENKYWKEDDESKNYASNTEIYSVVNKILDKSGFSATYSTGIKPTDILLRRGSVMNNLKIAVDAYGVELKRDNHKIGLEARIGTDKGIQLRYSKNIKSIKKSIDMRNIIHRLYVYGKDGLTIDSVNGGKAYLDCTYIGNYKEFESKIKVSEITFNNITKLDDLLEKGKEYLEKYQNPQISYDVNIVELQKLSGMIYDQSFGIGDNVTIIDEELNTDVKARVVEYRYYPFEPKESSVVLGNFIPRATDFFTKWNSTSGVVDNAFFKDTGKVNTKWLEGIIDVMQNKLLASGAYQTAEVIEDKGFLLENLDTKSTSYGALYLGPGMFSIADHKTSEGKWEWRTFGTGAGFTADVINTGILNAEVVKASELKVGEHIQMGENATISWDNVITNDKGKDNLTYLTEITKNTITTDYLKALKIEAGSVNTDWLNAREINASKITTGELNATLITTGTFDATSLKVRGLVVGDNVTMGASAEINWSQVNNQPDIGGIATKITKDTINTSFINALDITAKAVNAKWVYAGKIKAENITAGTLDVSDKSNNRLELSPKGLIGYSTGEQKHGVWIDNQSLGYAMVYQGNTIANLYFDTNGEGTNEEARRRVFLKTNYGIPLKFESDSGISFKANDKIYFASPVQFNSEVDFTSAKVTGLSGLDAVAKFG